MACVSRISQLSASGEISYCQLPLVCHGRKAFQGRLGNGATSRQSGAECATAVAALGMPPGVRCTSRGFAPPRRRATVTATAQLQSSCGSRIKSRWRSAHRATEPTCGAGTGVLPISPPSFLFLVAPEAMVRRHCARRSRGVRVRRHRSRTWSCGRLSCDAIALCSRQTARLRRRPAGPGDTLSEG